MLKDTLWKFFAAYRSRGFTVSNVLFDGEGALKTLTPAIEALGIKINPTAKDEHVPEIERAGRQLKERVRGFWSTLPYRLTLLLLIYLVNYCVKYINMVPRASMIGHGMVSPREIFLGRKVDASRECKIAFGD